jgi:hypothetical protein
MAFSGNINLSINGTLTGTAGDFTTPTAGVSYSKAFTIATGVGAGQADMFWSDARTLADGATEDLDLSGSLTSHLGGTLTFARIKALLIKAADANTTNLTVTRSAANGVPFLVTAGDGFVLKPGQAFLLTDLSAAGVVVTAATGDLLTITNGAGAAATYDIIVIGGLT